MEWPDEPGLMALDLAILNLPCVFLSRFLIRKLATNANKETAVDDFFAKLGALHARLNLLSKPMQIFNVDETGISVMHKTGKVVTQIGHKNMWSITSAEKGKTQTVITCVAASGFAIPPMMTFPRKRMTEKLQQGAIPETFFECSDSGWINEELYIKWFRFCKDSTNTSCAIH